MTPILRVLAVAVVLPCSGVFAQEKKEIRPLPDVKEVPARSFFQTVWNAKITDDSLSVDMGPGSKTLRKAVIDDESLQLIAEIKSLRELKLINTHVTGSGFGHLKNLDKLEILSMEGSIVNDAGLKELKHLAKLKTLNIKGTRVTSDGHKYLSDCKALEILMTTLSTDTIEVLAKAGKLKCLVQKSLAGRRILELDGMKITDEGFALLGEIPNVEVLFLYGTKITDKSATVMAKMKLLAGIEVPPTFTDRALKDLAGLEKLERLAGIKATGGLGKDYLALRSLRMLEVRNADDDIVANVSKLPDLKVLKLSKAKLSLSSLEHFHGMQSLETLTVSHYPYDVSNSVTVRKAEEAVRKALPKCKVMFLKSP